MNGPLSPVIAMFRELGKITEEFADKLVEDLQTEIQNMPARQAGLGGDAWAPAKRGGSVLNNSPSKTSVRRAGNIIWLTLRGHEVYHQAGAGRLPVRAVLPLNMANGKIGNLIRNNFAMVPRALAGALKK